MYVRVYDRKENRYYKSIVYATVGIGWFLQFIVVNPYTRSFELVDYLDKQSEPGKPLVEIIQPDHREFVIYNGARMLKYKYFCKLHGKQYVDIQNLTGYSDVLENNAFLADILVRHSVPCDAYSITARALEDTAEWNYIFTQEDADKFMKLFVGFHDSTLEKIQYSETNGTATVNAVFDNSGWFGVAELCFEGVQMLKIVPAAENYFREIFEATLIVDKERVFWADGYMEKPDSSHEGSVISALSLKWRKI